MKTTFHTTNLLAIAALILPAPSSAQFTALWSPQQTQNPSTSGDYPYAVAVDAGGVYIAGFDNIPGNNQWRIEKRNLTTGALVAGFGSSGVVTSNPSTGGDYIRAIALDASGIYLAGVDNTAGNLQWRIEKRSLSTGALISAFGGSGAVTSNPSAGSDMPYSIAIDASGIYVAGYDNSPGNNQWRIEKRDLTTGAPISAFGSAGVVTVNHSTFSDIAYAITADASGIYLSGTDYSPGDYQWSTEKRDLTTGALITSFGSSGVVSSNPGSSNDQVYAIAVDASGVYVAGSDFAGQQRWRIEKLDPATGAYVTSFGTGGVVISDPSAVTDIAQAITAMNGSIYIGGTDGTPLNQQWRIEQRNGTTGALLCNRAFNPSGSADYIFAIASDTSGIYVAGSDFAPGNYQWRMEKYDLCTALPVTLLGFSGYAMDVSNILEWSTASETNTAYFAVERSGDGAGFREIGRVQAAGQTAGRRKYSFTDTAPLPGINLYRLRQDDYDGTYTYSHAVIVHAKESGTQLRVIQNHNTLDILSCDAKKAEVFDICGRAVISQPVHGKRAVIDISGLRGGTYVLKAGNYTQRVLITNYWL